MRLSPIIHLLASGDSGISLTDAYDCNCWMIETAEGGVLFDAGAGQSTSAMLAELAAAGHAPGFLRHIFLTHAHADHSGGVAPLLDAGLSELALHAGGETAARMAFGDERRISLDTARRFGVYPQSYQWRGAVVSDILADREKRTIGGVVIEHLATPGHSADHSAYLVVAGENRILIAGDAVFAGGTILLQDIPDCDVHAVLESLRLLDSLDFETFLPGHGLFAMRKGRRHVSKAADFARRGLVPPSP